jgi:hypothetical protein
VEFKASVSALIRHRGKGKMKVTGPGPGEEGLAAR